MTDPPKPDADDDSRDAHLLAALRHAPDRDLAPPARVTAAILDQAQAAVLGSRARSAAPRGGWRSIWGQLWQPAPMAAFGTVAMATLIGVLWGGKELPEATPSWRPEAVATAPESNPATSTMPAPAQTAAAPAPTPATAPPAAANAARPAAPPADKRSAAEAKSELRAEDEIGQAQRLLKEKPRQSKPDAEGTSDAVTTGKLDESPADLPRLAAPKAPPAQPAQSPPAAIVQERMAAAPEPRRDAFAKSMADAAAPPARARNERAALGAAASATVSPLAPAGAELDAALGRDVAGVEWRIAAGRQVGHQNEQRAWWLTLTRATEGRWQRAAAATGGAAAAANLVLLIDGVPRGSLVFEPQAVIWRDANGATWRAPIDAGTLRDWQETLARW